MVAKGREKSPLDKMEKIREKKKEKSARVGGVDGRWGVS